MKRILIFLILSISSFNFLCAQNEFFSTSDNKLETYFSLTNDVTIKSKCAYYRILEFDAGFFPFSGRITDFTWDGNKIFSGTLKKGVLEGFAEYYYPNGKLKIKGNYSDGYRNGIWEYFYPNDEIEKRLRFKDDSIFVIDYFDKKGKQLVINGDGKYNGSILLGWLHEKEYHISGKIENYLFQGNWHIGSEIEKYDNGKLINGYGSVYKGFFNTYPSECFNLFKSVALKKSSSIEEAVLYKANEISDFIITIKRGLENANQELQADTYWVLLSFDLDHQGNMINHKIISDKQTVNDSIKEMIFKKWRSNDLVHAKEVIDLSVFIPIVVYNNEIIIPEIFTSSL